MPSYTETLRDPRWQKKRLEILQRDEWSCQRCFDDEQTLAVHHRYYLRGADPWEYPNDALVTLCERCHEMERNAEQVDRTLIITLRKRGAFNKELLELAEAFNLDGGLRDEVDWSVILHGIRQLNTPYGYSLAREEYFAGLAQKEQKRADVG